MVLAVTVVTLVGILGFACGGSPNEKGGASGPVTSDPGPAISDPGPVSDEISKSDGSSDRIVVYSGRSESLVGPIIERFEAATGIEVAVKYGSTSEIAATLLEEGDNSPADIFFAQDPGGLGVIDKAGMFAELPEDILELAPSWAESPQGRWVGISGRARVVVYNTDELTRSDLPASIEEFTSEEWKGRVGWPPTNGSFQAMVTAMRVIWGEERTTSWLKGMQANETKEYPNNTSIVAATESGEVDAGLVNHYYLYRFISESGETFGARNYYPTAGGPDSLVMVAGVGILDTAANRSAAEGFIKYMLSRDAQQYFANETFEYPVIEGVATHRLLTPLEDVNKPDIDMADLDDLQGTQALLRDLGILN